MKEIHYTYHSDIKEDPIMISKNMSKVTCEKCSGIRTLVLYAKALCEGIKNKSGKK